ncbi:MULTISPECIES: helix-turn-helix transcriptional regulator [Bacillus]|uniref:helix-turn-helix transcriptional regulator n=1 Tax=Bacillus TaxID=1386 RepID=UPI000476B767|nr:MULTISPECIES: helix-turn-helix transcriptional regulator [Bacillus]
MGLGKPNRTRLGEFLDERGISQEWLVNKSGVSRNTISRLANGKNEYNPSVVTMKKIIEVLREIDPDMKSSDIFDI